jgi:hypothetical protein
VSEQDDRPARGYAAADLSRLLPTGSLEQPVQAPPTAYDETSYPTSQVGGPAVVTPLPRPKPVVSRPGGGLPPLSLPARIVVGAAMAVALGWMVWNAWLNIVG